MHFLLIALAVSGLARVRAQGELRWAGDLQGGEPYVFRDPRDPSRLIGFEVELAEALARRLGVRAKFVQNDWSNLVPSLERGDFDLIVNGLEDTPALHGRILISRPYLTFSEQLVVRKGFALRTLDQLAGHRVGTLSSSLAHQLLRARPAIEIVLYGGQEEPYRDLQLGRTDAVLLDSVIAARYGLSKPDLELADADVARGSYVIGLRKGDGDLQLAVNGALEQLEPELRQIVIIQLNDVVFNKFLFLFHYNCIIILKKYFEFYFTGVGVPFPPSTTNFQLPLVCFFQMV